ncbi:Diphosphomevalonate decarboxylase [Rhizodiscina lignyota]|uniref:Diphosphomevalonate decarboxylase n=1 Tax=Rhizodiscina lignyota TaxID=1504668 RepID=A0A9P4IJ31_9PEZI|nr:Diphosphomevalonate decarboxylase [Rhizodiscina lignyota]
MAEDKSIYCASVTAPVNIAVVKYWGKRDPKLNLPTNSSLSVTLSQSDLRTHTTASCSSTYPPPDTLILNGQSEELNNRTLTCLKLLRSMRAELESSDATLPKLSQHPLKVVTANNFPTAAGLASSAAGFAALVYAIAQLYQLPHSPTELSRIARQGSGSACRSLFGGYVAWEGGEKADGSDSLAVQVAPPSHWPGMRALILVVSAAKKGVSSTSGMQQTCTTSALFQHRVKDVVPRVMGQMKEAVEKKDFDKFAEITMRDSNNFHACCLDTTPPIFYMNDVSRAAVRMVEWINEKAGRRVAAYTFDAGPNCVVYYEEGSGREVAGTFKGLLGGAAGWDGERGRAVEAAEEMAGLKEDKALASVVETLTAGVNRVILTGVGEGPMKVDEHLVDEKGEAVVS